MDVRHAAASILLVLFAATPAAAQAPGGGTPADPRVQQIQQLEKKLEAAEKYMQGLRTELEALKRGQPGVAPVAPTAATPPPPPPRAEPVPAPVSPQPAAPPQQQARVEPQPAEDSGPSPDQERPTFTPAFLRQANAVLIPRNVLEIDPRFQYAYNDSNILAVAGLDLIETIFIGTIEVERRRRDSFVASVDGRFGITDRLQISANVPYRFEIEELTLPPQVQRLPDPFPSKTNRTNGLGDIEFGLSYHALREKGWFPDLIVGASVKTNTGEGPFDAGEGETATGTGFWGVQPQLTLVKVTDPGILFASASYLYHIEDDVGRIGDVDPGDILQVSAGYGYALNPYLSLTTRLQLSHAWNLAVNGEDVSGTDLMAATMSFGLTYGFTRSTALDITADVGLTDDAPDFRISVGIPWQFRLPPWREMFRRRPEPAAP